MTAFSRYRYNHQNPSPAQVTGEVPLAAVLAGFPHDSTGSDRAHASQNELDYRAMSFGWAGCIDAPEMIPMGSHRGVVINGVYEGAASRSVLR